MTRASKPRRDSAPSPELAKWRTTRVTAFKNSCPVEAGYVFTGDPTAAGFSFGSYEPLNEAARKWESGFVSSPARPKWRATKRTVANNRVVEAGTEFVSDNWPDRDWVAVNEAAESVATYFAQCKKARLPLKAWVDDALNTIEAQAQRDYRPPPSPAPQWPFGNVMPSSARGFAPSERSAPPASTWSPGQPLPRTIVRPK